MPQRVARTTPDQIVHYETREEPYVHKPETYDFAAKPIGSLDK